MMLAELFEWIKRMIYLTIFLTLLIQLLPRGSYRKYVRFFAGLIFVVTVLNPLMELLGREDWEERLISGVLFEETAAEGELDFSYMEEKQREYYAKSMETAVREIAKQEAEGLGIEITGIEVDNSGDDGSILSVTVWTDTPSDILLQDLRETLMEALSLNESQVEVKSSGGA